MFGIIQFTQDELEQMILRYLIDKGTVKTEEAPSIHVQTAINGAIHGTVVFGGKIRETN